MLVVLVPITYIKQILLAMGQDPQVVDVAAMYIYYVLPGAFLNALSMQIVFYCYGLESTAIGPIQTVASSVSHILGVVILVGVFNLGFQGICIATSF